MKLLIILAVILFSVTFIAAQDKAVMSSQTVNQSLSIQNEVRASCYWINAHQTNSRLSLLGLMGVGSMIAGLAIRR